MRYRPEIDGLRAISVISVIFFHADFILFKGGFLGVDIFFVISGYLITTIILNEKRDGMFSIIGFYERRTRRILPAFFLVAFTSLPFTWILILPNLTKDFANSLTASSIFCSNILFWKTFGYFANDASLKPLLHTWSLAVEEQFYIAFPLILTILWPLGIRIITALCLASVALSLGLSDWAIGISKPANFYLAPFRAWELGIGAFIACVFFNKPLYPSLSVANTFSLIGLALIIIPITTFDKYMPLPGYLSLVPTTGACLIIVFCNQQTLVGRLLSTKYFIFIGLISYSAYLWHYPIFSFAKIGFGRELGNAVIWLLILLTIICSYFSWRYVEKPFRNRKFLSKQQVFSIAGVGTLTIAAVGVAGIQTDGFPQRFPDPAQAIWLKVEHSPKRGECHSHGEGFLKPEESCTYFGSKITYGIIGDSHAVEPAYELASLLEPRGEGLIHFSYSGGQPAFLYPESSAQRDFYTLALNYLVSQPEIRTVVSIFRHSVPGGVRDVDTYWASFRYMIEALTDAGKKVVVVKPLPQLRQHVENLIYRGNHLGSANGIGIVGTSREEYEKKNREILSRMDKLNGIPNVIVVDPTKWICDALNCYAVRNSSPLYFDHSHLSLIGAKELARQILESTAK